MRSGYTTARWIISALYMAALILTVLESIGAYAPARFPVPIGVLTLTVTYGVLMVLLWLHERFPPPK